MYKVIYKGVALKGAAEIGICNECIKPYLPRKKSKLFGAILICICLLGIIVLILSGVEYKFSWWYTLMLLFAAYQAYQWFSEYVASGDVTKIDSSVLQNILSEILNDKTQIDEKVIINWDVLNEKRKSLKVTASNFADTDFMKSVRTPISIKTSSEDSPVWLELIPEVIDFNCLPDSFNDEDKELLKESIRIFRQEKR